MKKDYLKQIQVLNSTLWGNRALRPRIEEWLNNFSLSEEKDYALYMLSRLIYYNSNNIRNLLIALYRDLFRYPIIKKIREDNGHTIDEMIIEKAFYEELMNTRFLGVGNPSESGAHLLYYFRQENKIPKDLFVNTDDIIEYDSHNNLKIRDKFKNVRHFVFIDDVCGSGTQATSDDSNVKRCVSNLKGVVTKADISYFMLFGLTKGIEIVRNSKLYDKVEAVITLDETYQCFSDKSRYFNDNIHDKKIARQIAYKYGFPLAKFLAEKQGFLPYEINYVADHRALGFGNCQLLLSMHHNTPDNSLPIIWFDEDDGLWTPIFKRYNKVY